MDFDQHQSFGVFKPIGHVVVSFPTQEQAVKGVRALAEIGLVHDDVHYLSDRQMLQKIEHDLADASTLASIGQELNLARAQRDLAQLGYHWLVVRARNDGRAAQIADCLKPLGAERAQHYGRFIIEELIEHVEDTAQVAESPDRGLNAQTPSGEEAERAQRRGPQGR